MFYKVFFFLNRTVIQYNKDIRKMLIMKIKGIKESEIRITVNHKEVWQNKKLIDFNLWNQEYDLRMKAEDHIVLSELEVDVLNKQVTKEEMVMDIDLVTSNIHVVPNGCAYGEVLLDFYNSYIKDKEWNPLPTLEIRGGSFAWKPWKNKVWMRVVEGDVIYLAHFESVAFRMSDEKMIAKLADMHFYKGFGWDQVHTKDEEGIHFYLPTIDEIGNVECLDDSYIPNIDVSMLFDETTTTMEKEMLARCIVLTFEEYVKRNR